MTPAEAAVTPAEAAVTPGEAESDEGGIALKLGMCMASLLDRGWEEALDATLELGILSVEAMGGGHVPRRHVDPQRLATSEEARHRLTAPVRDRGMEIAAIGCYGNFLDPDAAARKESQEDLKAAIRSAAELGIGVVTSNAGCPGGAPGDTTPNWVVHSLFPKRWDEAYRWQWEECALPFWSEIGRLAGQAEVDVCLEPMAGDVVYNLSTFRRLREHSGERIKCHVDPSHLWWQGIDIFEFIGELRRGDRLRPRQGRHDRPAPAAPRGLAPELRV